MIAGAEYTRLQPHDDQRGWLAELVRSDDPCFDQFGQVYMSVTYPGIVKAWHLHERQIDLISCVSGAILLVLHDLRDGSETHGQTDEHYLGRHNLGRVRVPSGVHHGWKCVSTDEALVISLVSELYDKANPDEHRLPPHSDKIPYDWTRRDG